MITAEQLGAMYARNLMFIHEKTAGFSHADALLQPPVPGNCTNWIVGHIAVYRNRILGFLGREPTLDPAIGARYVRDSPPVLGDEPGIGQLADLLAALDAAQGRLEAALRELTPERAAETVGFGQFSMSLAEMLLFLLRHEAYHTGQLELLHELAQARRAAA